MINWEKFETELKTIKYNYCLIVKFFNFIHTIEDTIAAKMLRYIIIYNPENFIFSFYQLSENIPNNYFETKYLICTFYNLQNEKIKFTELILKWKQVYKNKGFWEKNLIEQINSLILLKSRVLSNFDNSHNGMSFGMSILPTMISDINNSKDLVIDECITRLRNVYILLGKNFFKVYNIQILPISEFINLSDQLKVDYINFVHMRCSQILSENIHYFESYNMVLLKIDNLLHPIEIIINEINENKEIIKDDNSDTEDFSTMFN